MLVIRFENRWQSFEYSWPILRIVDNILEIDDIWEFLTIILVFPKFVKFLWLIFKIFWGLNTLVISFGNGCQISEYSWPIFKIFDNILEICDDFQILFKLFECFWYFMRIFGIFLTNSEISWGLNMLVIRFENEIFWVFVTNF